MRNKLLPALTFAASLLLYLSTLAPTVVTLFDDSLEMQLAVPTLAILHPTGYPLYEILAFTLEHLIPWGDAAYRVNLFSALAAATAITLLYLLARHLRVAPIPALSAALLLAISPAWHAQATIAEVYTFQGAITLGILYTAIRWAHAPASQRQKWLMALALAVGMGLAHHRLTLLLLPGLFLFIFWVDAKNILRPRVLASLLPILLAPLLTYLLLPLRAHIGSLDGSYARLGFWPWLAGGGYGQAFILENPFGIQRTVGDLLTLARQQFGWMGVGLLLISGPWWFKNRREALLLLLIAITDLGFAAIYKVQDIDVFLIPLFIIMALGIALGMQQLWQGAATLLASTQKPGLRAWGMPMVATLLLLLPGQSLAAHWPQLDRRHPPARAWGIHDYGHDMLESAGSEARVIGFLGEMTLLRYFQYEDEMGLGVQTLAADRDDDRMAGIAQSLGQGMTTFTTHPLDGLPQRYSLSAVGPLIQIWPPGQAQLPLPPQVLHQPLLPELHLEGWQAVPRQPRSGPSLRVRLWWQVQHTPPDFKISARLLGPDGALWVQQDAWPVHNAYPPTLWRAGETVLDGYDLALPTLPDTETTLLIILYNPADGAELARWQTILPPMR
jgi:hypothetical protein